MGCSRIRFDFVTPPFRVASLVHSPPPDCRWGCWCWQCCSSCRCPPGPRPRSRPTLGPRPFGSPVSFRFASISNRPASFFLRFFLGPHVTIHETTTVRHDKSWRYKWSNPYILILIFNFHCIWQLTLFSFRTNFSMTNKFRHCIKMFKNVKYIKNARQQSWALALFLVF